MERKQEYWDLFRESDGSFYKRMRRGECLIPAGLYHQSVEIVATDGKGYLLLTRRSFMKSFGAGKLEFPAGSVISGEVPVKAAIRELYEETGLIVSKVQKIGEHRVPGIRKFLFLAIIPDLRERTIRLQLGETIGYEFVTYDEWMKLVVQGTFAIERAQFYTPGFYKLLKQYVGTPPVSATPESKEPASLSIQTVRSFSGRQEGISGKAIYEDEEEEEELLMDLRQNEEADAEFLRNLNADTESEDLEDEIDTTDPSAG